MKCEGIVEGLLGELKSGGWIRTEGLWDSGAFRQMFEITIRVYEHFNIWNALNQLEPESKLERFLVSQKVGFTDQNAGMVWFYELLSVFLDATESFRSFLALILRQKGPFKGNLTLGTLIRALKQECSEFGPQFASEVDVGLRNPIAHGRYWLRKTADGSIYLNYCEELGEVPTIRLLSEIAIVIKKQALFGNCVTETVSKKGNAGYFKSVSDTERA
jgi:hypothetical protein